MARVSTVVLVSAWASSALGGCEPARGAEPMRRTETVIAAAQRSVPEPVKAKLPEPEPAERFQPLPPATPDPDVSPANRERPLVRDLANTREVWQARLRRLPELAPYARVFMPLDLPAIDAALRRGQRSRASITSWSIAQGAFAWSPDHVHEYFVVSGSIGARTLIAVLEAQESGVLRHAASLVIDDKDGSVALGSSPDHPNELIWTSCYACPGEGGSILLGNDGRPTFVYR